LLPAEFSTVHVTKVQRLAASTQLKLGSVLLSSGHTHVDWWFFSFFIFYFWKMITQVGTGTHFFKTWVAGVRMSVDTGMSASVLAGLKMMPSGMI